MAKRMAEQMELFEPVERGFDEGGLMDEGGTVDPVSGNDVPPGSTQEEVRDDIPAQLSEGEFVFPADVVRYIGLENLMRMRQEAKQGLAQMDAMGQMGNSEEATVEDDLPFDMYDLDVEDDGERNFNVGGYVAPTVPTNPYSQPGQVNPQTGTYTLPGTGIAGYQVPTGGQTGYTPYGGAAPYFQPVQFAGPQFQTALQTTNLPTFADTVGSNIGKYDELRTYINDAGQILQIPFKDGKPIYPIPEGYRPKGDEPVAEQPTTTIPVSTPITNQGDGGGDGDVSPSSTLSGLSNTIASSTDTIGGVPSTLSEQTKGSFASSLATEAKHSGTFGGHAVFGVNNASLAQATRDQAVAQAFSLSITDPISSAISGNPTNNSVAVAGQTAKNAALSAMALADMSQLSTSQQATMVGNVISAAHEAAKKGVDINAAIAKEIANHPAAMKTGLQSAAAKYGDLQSLGVTSLSDLSKTGVMASIAEIASAKSQELSDQAAAVASKGAVKTASGPLKSKTGVVMTQTALDTVKALQREKARLDALAKAAAEAAQMDGGMGFGFDGHENAADDEMGDDDVGGGASTGSSNSGGGHGMGDGTSGVGDDDGDEAYCLTEDMKVKRNGVIDFVTKVQVGDIIDNTVVTEVLHKHMREGYYVVNGELKITNDHPVLANDSWKRTEDLVLGDYINNIEVTSLEYIEQVTPTVYIGTAEDRYDVYTEGEVYTVHGQYKNALKKAA